MLFEVNFGLIYSGVGIYDIDLREKYKEHEQPLSLTCHESLASFMIITSTCNARS
jgi:hypothetical protein